MEKEVSRERPSGQRGAGAAVSRGALGHWDPEVAPCDPDTGQPGSAACSRMPGSGRSRCHPACPSASEWEAAAGPTPDCHQEHTEGHKHMPHRGGREHTGRVSWEDEAQVEAEAGRPARHCPGACAPHTKEASHAASRRKGERAGEAGSSPGTPVEPERENGQRTEGGPGTRSPRCARTWVWKQL